MSSVEPRDTSATCPLCHTLGPVLSEAAGLAGADWRCAVCHQSWNATRLATVASYVGFCADRERSRVSGAGLAVKAASEAGARW